jgi:hypothetical protein
LGVTTPRAGGGKKKEIKRLGKGNDFLNKSGSTPVVAVGVQAPILPAIPVTSEVPDDGKPRYYSDSEAGAIVEAAGTPPGSGSVPAKVW